MADPARGLLDCPLSKTKAQDASVCGGRLWRTHVCVLAGARATAIAARASCRIRDWMLSGSAVVVARTGETVMSIASESQPSEPTPQAAQGPLDARQLEQVAQAGERRRRLGLPVGLARGNGFTLIAAGLLCLPFAALEPPLVLVGLALLALGAVELRGAAMWKRLDLRAPRLLAYNQLALFVIVAIYCAVHAYQGVHAPPPSLDLGGLDPELSSQVRDLGGALGHDDPSAAVGSALKIGIVAFYVFLALACGAYQGACAYFYLSRGALMREHLERTPAWVMELERRWSGW
jgi:hypothetical protein